MVEGNQSQARVVISWPTKRDASTKSLVIRVVQTIDINTDNVYGVSAFLRLLATNAVIYYFHKVMFLTF